jgi:glycosyltransferase involved in cell wall biosynthesis
MHEHYTAMLRMSFEAKVYRKFRPFAFILLSLLRIEEKIACRWSGKVIVVADEHIERIESLGLARDNIVVVTNTEDVDYFRAFAIDESLAKEYLDDFVILYVGGFSPHRGLETAIEAMPKVLQKIPNARLLLVGDGPSRTELEEMVRDKGLTERITFTGQEPLAKMPTYVNLSSVCLIPHISTPHIETTMPNKIFQFMMLGKPVVVSSTRPMMRIVNDAGCGLIFEERNAKSLAETIIQLADDDLRRRLGENARRAVKDRYNWKETVQALLDLYSKAL